MRNEEILLGTGKVYCSKANRGIGFNLVSESVIYMYRVSRRHFCVGHSLWEAIQSGTKCQKMLKDLFRFHEI